MRIGSLFSGIGGLDLAVETVTGGHIVWHAETDPYASAVLAKHWPGVPNLGDVRGVTNPPAVDVLCGGFPCQDISSAGKRKGIEGAKSGLWAEFARLIRELGPRIVFVENVSALKGRGLDVVLGDLAARGFDAEWSTLTAAAVGAPHRRDRLFVLAYRDRECLRQLAERREQQSAKRRDGEPRFARPDVRCGSVRSSLALVANAMHDGLRSGSAAHHDDRRHAHWHDPHGRDAGLVFPPAPDDGDGWARWTDGGGPAPGVHRGAYGAPKGLDARRRRRRLRHLGNGVVPRQAAAAFLSLERVALDGQ